MVKKFRGQVGPGTLGQEEAKRLVSIIKSRQDPRSVSGSGLSASEYRINQNLQLKIHGGTSEE